MRARGCECALVNCTDMHALTHAGAHAHAHAGTRAHAHARTRWRVLQVMTSREPSGISEVRACVAVPPRRVLGRSGIGQPLSGRSHLFGAPWAAPLSCCTLGQIDWFGWCRARQLSRSHACEPVQAARTHASAHTFRRTGALASRPAHKHKSADRDAQAASATRCHARTHARTPAAAHRGSHRAHRVDSRWAGVD